MTPAALGHLCEAHGHVRLARLLGWHYSTLWRKKTGKSKITKADELTIRLVIADLEDSSTSHS
jgi:hypothetical protein